MLVLKVKVLKVSILCDNLFDLKGYITKMKLM